MNDRFSQWHTWIVYFSTLAGVIALVVLGHAVLIRIFKRLTLRHPRYEIIVDMGSSIRVILLFIVLLILLPASPFSGGVQQALEHAIDLGLIASAAWALIVLLDSSEKILSLRYRLDVADNLLARRVRTRMQVFHHVIVSAIIFLSLAIALMTFPNVRSLGASLLASAGLAGIVVGMAARPALSNLIAGLQIALTEPISIDDVVIVEGEWGNVEEINATYVVVKIWDLRRMILPLSYFIEHPFQNWTRTSADILGSVFLYVDYRVPVDPLRDELTRILKSSPLWKGQVNGLQVTDASERTVQLRMLMDAVDSGKAFDLRCLVREKMIEFLQKNYPDSLPRDRMELTTLPRLPLDTPVSSAVKRFE